MKNVTIRSEIYLVPLKTINIKDDLGVKIRIHNLLGRKVIGIEGVLIKVEDIPKIFVSDILFVGIHLLYGVENHLSAFKENSSLVKSYIGI